VKNAFIHIVKEVLAREQFVTLPGLGSFIVKELNSTINPINGEIKPRHSSIIFNNKISEDDGVLTSQYKAIFSLSYKEAQDTIKREINLLENQLTNKKYFAFNPLGNFFFNETSGIFFVPKAQNNINTQSFGLKPLKWVAKTNNYHESSINIEVNPTIEIEDANVVEIGNEEITNKESKNNSNLVWRIAANFVLISITFATLYTSSVTWIRISKKNNIEASHIPTSTLTENLTDNTKGINSTKSNIPTEAKENFVFINGKLISLNKNKEKKSEIQEIMSLDEFRGQIKSQSGSYFILGGSYLTPKAAELECKNWNALGINATYIRVKGSSLNRIIVQRFSTAKDASDYLVNLKETPKVPVRVHELILQ